MMNKELAKKLAEYRKLIDNYDGFIYINFKYLSRGK